jgi:hypothetical protein
MNETMFIIEFMNGKTKKFDDNRFKYEIDYDGGSMRVFSRITKGLVLDIPTLANVAFIHTNVIKKQRKPNNFDKEVDDIKEMSVEEAMLMATEDVANDDY